MPQLGQKTRVDNDVHKSANKLTTSTQGLGQTSRSMKSTSNTNAEIENQESKDDVTYHSARVKIETTTRKNHYQEETLKNQVNQEFNDDQTETHDFYLDQKHAKNKAGFEESNQTEPQIIEKSEKTIANLSQPTSAMYKRVNARGLFADINRENLCPKDVLNGIMVKRSSRAERTNSPDSCSGWLKSPHAADYKQPKSESEYLQWRQ